MPVRQRQEVQEMLREGLKDALGLFTDLSA
ncbi:hypothetical protein SBV1_2830005 [Verrucomicrobia bacterium]|nr:hypothetical protein SBV1_2830005 [Verrucomicrobiota bacterium]